MLFEKEIKEADEKLYKKGYYLSNMAEPYNDLYEVYDKNSNVVIDYLSITQLIQLSNILNLNYSPIHGESDSKSHSYCI